MNQSDIYKIIFNRNQNALMNAVDGLTQSHSLLQLPGDSNCMNWILGHIAVYRDGLLMDAGLDEHMLKDEVEIYGPGSDAIDVGSTCVKFDRLVELIELSYATLDHWLSSNPDSFDNKVDKDVKYRKGYGAYWDTINEHISQMIAHESMHVGELSALRELALISKI
ncbi:MAG TPA: hypothetical protein DGM69_00910 [Chloroflexi bacterium]|nr:hypothetical protein [Chloroflexota bacterium]|tara:strand:- start:1078 stop:1575 length:498 start_codon:yes stop_codon:yes gene_type:complete